MPQVCPLTDEELLGVVARRGCISLRALCQELWPALRWRPLCHGDGSAAEEVGADGLTYALRVWLKMGALVDGGRIQVAGQDPDEVDALAGVTFELVGVRHPPRPRVVLLG